MENYGDRAYRYRLWGFAILTVLLASTRTTLDCQVKVANFSRVYPTSLYCSGTIFLTVSSLKAQRAHDPICRGIAGAGFPLTFVCDTPGESPTGSWGKIDEADRWFPNPFFLIDILFYTVLLWIPWFAVRGIARWIRHRS